MNIKSNPDGSLPFVSGSVEIVVDKYSIGQNIRSNIKTVKGEYWLNTSLGFDYKRAFQKGNTNYLRYAVKKAILDTVGVVSISNFSLTLNSERLVEMTADVITVDGTVQYKNEVII